MKQSEVFAGEFQPLARYPGRKGAAGTWQKIVSQIPACDIFIEAMCGSAFISSIVAKTSCHIVANDYNRSVIDRIIYKGANIEFRSEHYKAIVNRFDNGNPGRVFYFDPPYLMETRKSQLPLYRVEWEERDHVDFLKVAQAMKCPVMISQYPCNLYDTELIAWRKISYQAVHHGNLRTENLYMNFPAPVLLQCYKHFGADFTDRQRVGRKVSRLIGRLNKEAPGDRAAILSALVDYFRGLKSPK